MHFHNTEQDLEFWHRRRVMNAFVIGKKVMSTFFPGCMSSRLLPGKLGTAEIRIDSPNPWARLRGAVHGMP